MEAAWGGVSLKINDAVFQHFIIYLDISLAIIAIWLIRRICGTSTTDFVKTLFNEFRSLVGLQYTASSINGMLVIVLSLITIINAISSPLVSVLKLLGYVSSTSGEGGGKVIETVVLVFLLAVAGLLSVRFIQSSQK